MKRQGERSMVDFTSFCDRLIAVRERLKRRENSANREDVFRLIDTWKARSPNSKALRELLELAFFLSLERYEGRHTKTSIYCLLSPWVPPYVQRFNQALPATVKGLRQLAQVARGTNSAIEVKLDTEVCIVGIFQLNTMRLSEDLFVPGICIAIKGPGHIEYLEGSIATSYVRGQPRRLRQITRHPSIAKWIESTFNEIAQRAISQDSAKESRELALDVTAIPTNLFAIFLRAMLRAIESGGHGGAVLVVPDEHALKEAELGYSCDQNHRLDPLAKIAQKFMTNRQFESETGFYASSTEFDVPFLLLDQVRRYGFACGNLANCDGAIVVTRSGLIRGFAAIINAPRREVVESHEMLKHSGARHNSAFWFCESVLSSLAIVVSSDGNITVMQNEDGCVKVTKDLIV